MVHGEEEIRTECLGGARFQPCFRAVQVDDPNLEALVCQRCGQMNRQIAIEIELTAPASTHGTRARAGMPDIERDRGAGERWLG